MKNLVIFSQYFYPSLASTSQLMTDLVVGLCDREYTIEVVTGTQLSKNNFQSLNKFKVIRFSSPFLESQSIIVKLISSLIYLIGSLFYISFKVPALSSILIVSNPPYVGIIGIFFKFLKKGNFYFLLQDIFPESAVYGGIIKPNSIFFKISEKIIYLTYFYCQKTIVLTESMKKFLEKKYPELKSKNKIEIIENWAIEDIPVLDKVNNQFAISYSLHDKFTVLYSGNIGRLHDIESMAIAIERLADRPIQWVFIGDGKKLEILKKLKIDNLLLLPFQPREMIPLSLTACDISLVSLVEGADRIIAPCKLYGMLASSRAIVAISSPGSYIEKLLTQYDCGVNCPPDSPDRLVEIIDRLSQDPERVKLMGKNARKLYEEKYTFGRALNEYEKLLFLDKKSEDL